jgi:hypothetical protein
MVALYGLPDSVRYLKQGFRVNLDRRQANNGWCDESIDQNPETRNINDEKGKRRADYYTSIMKEANIAYNRGLLLKAIRLCQHASVVPVLVTTPVYYTFRVHMDLQKYERMQEIVHSLGNESGAKYFNHLDDQRFDIDDFYDDDHLNGRGAEKFSKILDKEALQ